MSIIETLGLNNFNTESNYSDTQNQTKDIFGFKWNKRASYESPAMDKMQREWLLQKYVGGDISELEKIVGSNKIIVDAGCGSGYGASTLFGDLINQSSYLGIDISNSIIAGRERFKEKSYKGEFMQISLNDFNPKAESIDIIFSEGVLHHTDNTEKSFKHLAKKIKKGGYFLFYVYAKKAAIREYSDDYIRGKLEPMTDEEAWTALYSLTKLGKSLGELNVKLNVEEDIPYLGIKKGEIDIQRFFYWNIFKLFYRADFSIEEMNHVNFDWYRPMNCHRHTPEEVKQWCIDEGFDIEKMTTEEAGITIVAKKK
jgi:arsenite methyltransferase